MVIQILVSFEQKNTVVQDALIDILKTPLGIEEKTIKLTSFFPSPEIIHLLIGLIKLENICWVVVAALVDMGIKSEEVINGLLEAIKSSSP